MLVFSSRLKCNPAPNPKIQSMQTVFAMCCQICTFSAKTNYLEIQQSAKQTTKQLATTIKSTKQQQHTNDAAMQT